MHYIHEGTPQLSHPYSFDNQHEKTEVAQGLIYQIGNQTQEMSVKSNSSIDNKKITKMNEEYFFEFPENSMIIFNEKKIDISKIKINLSDVFIGGIGYGGWASRLMAQAMHTFGHRTPVYNLPVCIEGYSASKIQIISIEDKIVPPSAIKDMINQAIKNGFNHFNIPLDMDGHASLAALTVSNHHVALKFYDSLSPDIISYEERYHNKNLLDFIQSLLPNPLNLDNNPGEVFHLLDQGGKESKGCGYYAVYTALLLKDHEEIRYLQSCRSEPLFNQAHDKRIRAELAVRTLLAYGLDKVDLRYQTLINKPREGIFHALGFELKNLIAQLKQRLSEQQE